MNEAVVEIEDADQYRTCTCCGEPATRLIRVGNEQQAQAFGLCPVHYALLFDVMAVNA